MKRKVKMLDSVAGLADPKPIATLKEKYEKMNQTMRDRTPKPVPEAIISETIAQTKLRDRYGEPVLGFPRDFSFRPDEEVLIDSELAKKWEAAGTCVILDEVKNNKAA